jgi:hypothetical protein
MERENILVEWVYVDQDTVLSRVHVNAVIRTRVP